MEVIHSYFSQRFSVVFITKHQGLKPQYTIMSQDAFGRT